MSRTEQPELFDPAGRRRGRHERRIDQLVMAWRRSVGDAWSAEHDVSGSVMRGQARALDVAELLNSSTPTPYGAQSAAICARELRETLAVYGMNRSAAPTGADPFQAFLDSLATDATDSPAAPSDPA